MRVLTLVRMRYTFAALRGAAYSYAQNILLVVGR